MVERGDGRVINIASLLSFQGGLNVSAYTASKHGIAGLTKALGNEFGGRGLTVNAIAPGYIETDNTQALRDDPDRNKAISARIPMGRWGKPEDISSAAVFLASKAAGYINGEILTVDGGWMAR
jgi:2-deoxy-D-gluconate 3-dehydrogenase